VAKPEPTFTHGNGREPSREKTTRRISFVMERCNEIERRVDWGIVLKGTSG